MISNKSDEAEMTFFFLSLLSVIEGMDFFIFIFFMVLLKIFERLIFSFWFGS